MGLLSFRAEVYRTPLAMRAADLVRLTGARVCRFVQTPEEAPPAGGDPA
jgi:hypothetical protein